MVVGECVLFPSFPQMSDTAGRSAVLCCIISVAAITEWLFPLMCFWASAPIHSSSSFYICNCDSGFFHPLPFVCLYRFLLGWGKEMIVGGHSSSSQNGAPDFACVDLTISDARKELNKPNTLIQARKRLRPNQRRAPACWLYFSRVLIVSEIHKFFYRHRFSLENFEKLVVAPNIFILKREPGNGSCCRVFGGESNGYITASMHGI